MYLIFFTLCYLVYIPYNTGSVIFGANFDDVRALVDNVIPRNIIDDILLAIASNQTQKGRNSIGFNIKREGTKVKSGKKRSEKNNVIKRIQIIHKKKSKNDAHSYRDKKHLISGPKRVRKVSIPDKKYVAEIFIAPSPKYLHTTNVPNSLRPNTSPEQNNLDELSNQKRNRKKVGKTFGSLHKKEKYKIGQNKLKQSVYIKEEINNVRNKNRKPTTKYKNIATHEIKDNNQGLYEAIDMGKSNDSYEDYVLPKKDSNSYEEQPHTQNVLKKSIKSSYANDMNDSIFITSTSNYKKKVRHIEGGNSGDRTSINKFSKKKRFDVHRDTKRTDKNIKRMDKIKVEYSAPISSGPTGSIKGNDRPIGSYAQQMLKKFVDKTQAAAEDVFAGSGDIQRIEELKPSKSNDITAHLMGANKKLDPKKRRVPKGAIVVQKNNYEFSSPNYLAKIPVVAEKYNFNEPIPERDQEPENLKPIGQPSNINGKIRLTDTLSNPDPKENRT